MVFSSEVKGVPWKEQAADTEQVRCFMRGGFMQESSLPWDVMGSKSSYRPIFWKSLW